MSRIHIEVTGKDFRVSVNGVVMYHYDADKDAVHIDQRSPFESFTAKLVAPSVDEEDIIMSAHTSTTWRTQQ